jgi:Na+/proline symporter
MSSVAIEDIYRPYASKEKSEAHFLKASRFMVVVFAVLLSFMALLSYYWQQYTQLDLLSFALGVMAFAYAPLLGVYAAAIFTKRGSAEVLPYALVGGFLTVLMSQPYIMGKLFDYKVDYSVMMIAGTLVAFLMMMTRSHNEQ